MPTKPGRLCPACRAVITDDRCATCSPPWSTSTRRGSTRASRKLRMRVLLEQPICAEPDCSRLATEDDHIVGWSARGDMTEAEWDARENHQGLCADHHRAKTQRESKGPTSTS